MGAPIPGLGGSHRLSAAEVAVSSVNGFGVDCENGRAAIRGTDGTGLPIIVTLPVAALDVAIQALQSAKLALDAPANSIVVTETLGFQAVPVGKDGIDGIFAMFNAGMVDARCYALQPAVLPAIIRQLHDAGAAQHASRKRLICPT